MSEYKASDDVTLICDYSVNDLNQLMFSGQDNDLQIPSGYSTSMQPSPVKGISNDKYNQLTKLNDDEENVDFMLMFNQFQK